MGTVPPRSALRSSSSSKKDISHLETLELMGFPKKRAEKSIAATGNRGIHLASEWLLSHVNDPSLDCPEPREYILYLCPLGELQESLQEMYNTSLQVSGWNSAHTYCHHVTLCSFFTMPDNKVDVIDQVMKSAAEEMKQWPPLGPIGLDHFTQNKNFIGFFIKSPHHQFIEKLMITLQSEFLNAGIEMKPQMKQLHMTLAFQYEEDHHDLLLELGQEVDVLCESAWELRVYSRDVNTKNAEIRSIIKPYTPVQADELELVEGDYIYMDPREHERSPDGWFKGTSWKTGTSGFFPGNFTLQCSQMKIWTLHRSLVLPFLPRALTTNGSSANECAETKTEVGTYDNIWTPGKTKDVYAKVNKPKKSGLAQSRKLYIIRHAERCDFAFFRTWFDKSFDHTGRYTRINLNCPKTVVPRASYKDFNKDCPLTEIGKTQARMTGKALADAGETIAHVFCSPALRCVETAHEILTGLGSQCLICIEPILFEWCGWHKPHMPTFIPPVELAKLGYPIDKEYEPHIQFSDIKVYESIEDYYERSHNVTKSILRKHKAVGGNILFIGHSGTSDACTRKLQGKPARNQTEFQTIVRGLPYCFMCTLQEESSSGKWTLCQPPILELTHSANKEYSWQSLMN